MTLNLIHPEDPTARDMALAMIDRSLEIFRRPVERTSPSDLVARYYAQAAWHAHAIATDYEVAGIEAKPEGYSIAAYWANVRAWLQTYAMSYKPT